MDKEEREEKAVIPIKKIVYGGDLREEVSKAKKRSSKGTPRKRQ